MTQPPAAPPSDGTASSARPPAAALVALAALREQFVASTGKTLVAFGEYTRQLAWNPTEPDVMAGLRRELHRVSGTAGTYGFPEATRLAAELEERVVRWAADPFLDAAQRAAVVAQFVDDLAASLAAAQPSGSRSAPAPLAGLTEQASSPCTDAAEPVPAAIDARGAGRAYAAPLVRTSDVARGDWAPDVIVVEEDVGLSELLQYALRSHGFTYRTFATGPAALDALLRMEVGDRRAVVLLDVDLPGMDGHSLHERLRAERPDAFSVVFTAVRGAEAEQVRAIKGGAIDYIVKPLSFRVLMAKVGVWLELSRRAA